MTEKNVSQPASSASASGKNTDSASQSTARNAAAKKPAKLTRPLIYIALIASAASISAIAWEAYTSPTPDAKAPRVNLSSSTAVQAPAISDERSKAAILRQQTAELEKKYETLALQFNRLRLEVDALQEKNLATGTPPPPPLPPSASAPVSKPQPLEKDPSYQALLTTVQTLNNRLDTLQTAYEEQSGISRTRLTVLRVIDRLRDKLDSGAAYEDEIKELNKLLQEGEEDAIPRAALHTLEENAKNGIATLATLIDDFEEVSSLAVPVSLLSEKEPTFTDTLRAKLGHLISIRKTDVDSNDDTDEANIARAEAELRVGNVDMAITHLLQLSQEPKQLFKKWIKEANAHLAAHGAVADIQSLALDVAPQTAAPSTSEEE